MFCVLSVSVGDRMYVCSPIQVLKGTQLNTVSTGEQEIQRGAVCLWSFLSTLSGPLSLPFVVYSALLFSPEKIQ